MSRSVSALSRGHGAPVAVVALVVLVTLVAAVAFGALAAADPDRLAVTLALAALVLVSLVAPLASLGLLLFVAVLLPFSWQNQHAAVTGGLGIPGVLLIDVLLLVGLARVTLAYYLPRGLEAPALVAYALLAIAGVQLAHGVLNGASAGDAGLEARHVAMAIGAFLLSVPVLADPARREKLPALLLAVGLALGVWGLAQWFLNAPFNGSDFGVREGRFGTSSGRGQLQGGLYVYHVGVILAFAALVSGHVASRWVRVLIALALAMNGLCLFFTYERTFWIATVLGCLLVLMRGTLAARRRALKWAPPAIVAVVVALGVAAPGDLLTAFERGASVSQANEDESLEYRRVESQLVLNPISAQPVAGAGFGVEFTWVPPGFRGRELTTGFVHNGYLWLAWKTGLPFALLCVAALVASIARPGTENGSLQGVLRTGAKASLLALLVINITFPSFNALGIAVFTGLLVAMCWVPRRLT